MTNQIKILFYGVCLMMAVTGNSSTDIPNADVHPTYGRDRVSEIPALSSQQFKDVETFGRSLRQEIVCETNAQRRLDLLRRSCSATLTMPINSEDGKKRVYAAEVFMCLSEELFYSFGDAAETREEAWNFMLNALARYADEVHDAEIELQKVLGDDLKRIRTIHEQRIISRLRNTARSLRGHYDYMVRKHIDLAELRNDCRKLPSATRERLMKKTMQVLGRYPVWYHESKECPPPQGKSEAGVVTRNTNDVIFLDGRIVQ